MDITRTRSKKYRIHSNDNKDKDASEESGAPKKRWAATRRKLASVTMGNQMVTSKADRRTVLFQEARQKEIDAKLAEIEEDKDDAQTNGTDQNGKLKTRQKAVKSKKDKYTKDISKSRVEKCNSQADVVDSTTLKRYERLPTIMTAQDVKALEAKPADYVFPFENIVFEGGGNKGLAYCGAVRVLEGLGIWPQIKRIAGASAGAMTASLLAVGYDSHEIEEFLNQDLSKIFLDHSCGYLSLLPNLVKGFGWNPGNKIYKWFGQALAEKTGDPDITFREVYEKYGKELCITVTNLNQMCDEYLHPKTTPDMPVRLGVRMSMAIPGLFKAPRVPSHGRMDTYVDGGVLCNYPIHAFDGWWLSMKNHDTFLQKLQPLNAIPELLMKKERFGTYNGNTLGFLLYADHERDVMRHSLEKRIGIDVPNPPDTKLGRAYVKRRKVREKAEKEHSRVVEAVDSFLRVLKKHDMDNNDRIEKSELEAAFHDEEGFPPEHVEILFGRNATVNDAFDVLDKDKNGEIKYEELLHFIEETGIHLQARFLGYQRQEVNGFASFLSSLQSTLLTNVKRIYVDERDAERTVGINTGHVGTTDFKLEDADMEYIVRQGEKATTTFLKYYIAKNSPMKKGGAKSKTPSTSLSPDSNDDVFVEVEAKPR